MLAREDFLLENLCTSTFVDASDLENLRCVDIGVGSSAHNGYAANHAFVDLERVSGGKALKRRARLTCTDE